MRSVAPEGTRHNGAVLTREATEARACRVLAADAVARAVVQACFRRAVTATKPSLAKALAMLALSTLVAPARAACLCAICARVPRRAVAHAVRAVAPRRGACGRACTLRAIGAGPLRVARAPQILTDAVAGALVGAGSQIAVSASKAGATRTGTVVAAQAPATAIVWASAPLAR
jgi:hypothetical protein